MPNFLKIRQFILLQVVLVTAAIFAYQNCSTQVAMTSGASTAAATQSCANPSAVSEVLGTVTDATNQTVLSGVVVSLLNSAGATIQATTTNSSGVYTFNGVAAGTYKIELSKSGYITVQQALSSSLSCGSNSATDISLSPTLAAGEMRIVLTWAVQPANWSTIESYSTDMVMDLDSYLSVPGYSQPVFWDNCDLKPSTTGGTVGCTVTGAYLDVDKINWSGPETVTITNLASGTYKYYIANYSDPCNPNGITASKAVVTVYASTGVVKQYTINPGPPPVGSSGLRYQVFTINNGVVTDAGKYDDSLYILLSDNYFQGICSQPGQYSNN